MNTETIWNILDKFGIIIAILTFFVSLLIWAKLRVQSRKLKSLAANTSNFNGYQELSDFREGVQTENPMAFCLSLIPQTTSIKDDVDKFLSGEKMKMKIIELNKNGLDKKNLQEFIEDLGKKRLIDLAEATEVHLFLQGPVQAGLLIGAIFDNWKPVKLYQYNREIGTYEYWGPLVK